MNILAVAGADGVNLTATEGCFHSKTQGQTSPPNFNKRESQPLYTPTTTPSILLYLFLMLFNVYWIKITH
jgi:hypothetical protein